MATGILNSNGLVSAAVFGTVDATSLLDSEAANTVLTTSYVESAAFTPGAITIDGIAVKIATRAASPSGTMSVRLAQAAALVAGTEVTINVSDILGSALLQNGWIFFKFAAPVLLVAATAYTVSAKTSAASQVNLYRNATAANWSRMLRTTTNLTVAAGDNGFILGEFTAAGTFTARTLTWDLTAATDFGGASTTLAGWGVGVGGTVSFQANAATAYIMQMSAMFLVWVGGTLNQGTLGTPCPRDSSMTIQFDCAADGDFGLVVYGTWNAQGQNRLAGVDNHFALLNADAAAAATSLTTDRQLSLKNGDEFAIASTTKTVTESEVRTANADAGATTVTTASGLTNAHKGTTPVFAEIISLTRGVKVISTSSTFMTYVTLNSGCTVDCDWAEFKFIGAGTGKRGVEWAGASGSVNFNKCSFRDADTNCFYADLTGGVGAFTLTDCVFWKWAVAGGSGNAFFINEATSSTWTCTGCVAIGNNTSSTGFFINDLGGTFQNCRAAGCQIGYRILEETGGFPHAIDGTISGLLAHSCNSSGISLEGIGGGTISSLTAYRCGAACLAFTSEVSDLLIDTADFWGGGTQNISTASITYLNNITLRNVRSNGDTTFATTNGFSLVGSKSYTGIRLEACNFSTASTGKTAHTTDILFGASSAPTFCELYLINTTLAAATEIGNSSTLVGRSFIAYEKHEGVTGQNRRVYPQLGTVSFDSVTFRTASPSEQAAPTAALAGFKLRTGSRRVPIASGQTCTISTYVNKSALYNGNAPRLRVEQNSALGISEATVATHSSGAGSFFQLIGTVGPVAEDGVLSFYTDGDGSAGQWNVDDWSYSNA